MEKKKNEKENQEKYYISVWCWVCYVHMYVWSILAMLACDFVAWLCSDRVGKMKK